MLIIEDEALIAMMIEDSLIEAGATSVDIVASEADAVDAAHRHRPDFITSDVRLPQGTGPGAVAEILRCCGAIPVLFITASPDECAGCAADAIMRKPANPREIGLRFRALQH
ncbi:response regulator [Sphingomonas rubra]|uniref:response regulator n=1 Tax=Sphingomonas rubra TaxID=634430 RepID=UPI001FDEA61D|nr:response regulator [Sphingomonas rubra]